MKHKSFVPEFVLNIYNSGVQEYCFTGCVMIVDLSGFTQLTQSLMEDTSNGVDTLALIIKNIFSPLISEIHSIGGFVSSFAGDSFNAIFPNDTCNSSDVSTTATSLIEIVKNLSLDQKFNIENQINIKIGIGHGDITLGFAKDNFNSTYFFDGLGIRSAVRSVVKANSNEIIYSQSFIHSVNTSSLKPQAYDQDIYEHYNEDIKAIKASRQKYLHIS
ncbi:MAG: hypothetical protein B6226_00050 [Candidatus Cloacimonetes bacterium 4572_65]|nr:MAG: hypothetical protein B6226_00050 [Candidatus Cloacimonetes bacterium 4572_65]